MINEKEKPENIFSDIEKLEDARFLTIIKISCMHNEDLHGGGVAFQEIGRQLFGKKEYDMFYNELICICKKKETNDFTEMVKKNPGEKRERIPK